MNTEIKYRPFTEQDAKDGKTPVYRNGTTPIEWHLFEGSRTWKIVSVRQEGYILLHTSSGSITNLSGIERDHDLVIKKDVKEYWINLYKDRKGYMYVGYGTYASKLDAQNHRYESEHIDTVKVWEEYV